MSLSKYERYSLVNQLKILEKLYPDEAASYSEYREAIEGGFALEYEGIYRGLSDGLSEADCREVLDILDMYRVLTFSYKDLADKAGIEPHALKFDGFDGNNEHAQLAYATYYVHRLGRFQELTYGQSMPDLNSHSMRLDMYRRMLQVWAEFGQPTRLTAEQVKKILGARTWKP